MTVTVVKQQEHQTQQQKNQYINQKPSLELTTVLTNQYFHFYKKIIHRKLLPTLTKKNTIITSFLERIVAG